MQYSLNELWGLYKDLVLASTKQQSQKTETGRWENHIAPVLGSRDIESITTMDYFLLRRSVEQKGLSPQTVAHCLSLLRRILMRAYEWKLLKEKPVSLKNVMPKFDNNRIRFLSKEEAHLLLTAIRQISINWYDIVLLALNTGLRRGEVFRLSKNDVDVENNCLTVLDTKTSKNRTIPLNYLTLTLLKKRLSYGEYYLFNDSEKRAFSRAIKELGFNDGITDLRHKVVFYTLRHTFASWLVQDGVPLPLVSELLGHSNIQITMRYAHLAPQHGLVAVEQIAKRFDYTE